MVPPATLRHNIHAFMLGDTVQRSVVDKQDLQSKIIAEFGGIGIMLVLERLLRSRVSGHFKVCKKKQALQVYIHVQLYMHTHIYIYLRHLRHTKFLSTLAIDAPHH